MKVWTVIVVSLAAIVTVCIRFDRRRRVRPDAIDQFPPPDRSAATLEGRRMTLGRPHVSLLGLHAGDAAG